MALLLTSHQLRRSAGLAQSVTDNAVMVGSVVGSIYAINRLCPTKNKKILVGATTGIGGMALSAYLDVKGHKAVGKAFEGLGYAGLFTIVNALFSKPQPQHAG